MDNSESNLDLKIPIEKNFQKQIDTSLLPFLTRLEMLEERPSELTSVLMRQELLERKLKDLEVGVRQNKVDLSLLKNKVEMAFLELETMKTEGHSGSFNFHEVQVAYESQLTPIFEHVKRIDEKMLRIEQNTTVKTSYPTIEMMNASLKQEVEAMGAGLRTKLKGMKSRIKIMYNKSTIQNNQKDHS